jgi:hypothetical protein
MEGSYIYRVDAALGGNVIALKSSDISTAGEKAGNGTVYVFGTDGTQTANFPGHSNGSNNT